MSDIVIDKACYLSRSKAIAARALGDETMIMSARNSSLFTLNDTASAIWNAADGLTPLAQIVEQHVCGEFEVEPEQAMRDAEALVAQLVEHGILIVSDAPIPDSA